MPATRPAPRRLPWPRRATSLLKAAVCARPRSAHRSQASSGHPQRKWVTTPARAPISSTRRHLDAQARFPSARHLPLRVGQSLEVLQRCAPQTDASPPRCRRGRSAGRRAKRRALMLWARLDNREGLLRPGMFARVRLVMAEREADRRKCPKRRSCPGRRSVRLRGS